MPVQYTQPQSLDAITYAYRQRVPLTARGVRGGGVRITTASMDGTTAIVTDAAQQLGPVNALLAGGGTIYAVVQGAGAAGASLLSTVVSFTDAGHVVLADASLTATASAIAYFFADDTARINAVLQAYAAVDLESEVYGAWGLDPLAGEVGVYGNGGWLLQKQLGANVAHQRGLIDTTGSANLKGFTLDGVNCQMIPGSAQTTYDSAINYTGSVTGSNLDNAYFRHRRVSVYNAQAIALLVGFTARVVGRELYFKDCSQGPSYASNHYADILGGKVDGGQFAAGNGQFMVGIAFTQATVGVHNDICLCGDFYVDNVPDSEAYLCHDAEFMRFYSCHCRNVSWGYAIFPTLASDRITHARLYQSDYVGWANGSGKSTHIAGGDGLNIAGLSTGIMADFISEGNTFINGNADKNSGSHAGVLIGDYITRLMMRGDKILDSYANGMNFTAGAAGHIQKLLLDGLKIDGVTAGAGAGVGVTYGTDPTQRGEIRRMSIYNSTYGFSWANMAHPKTGVDGSNFIDASVTNPTTNGGVSGVAPVALSTLGTLL